MIEAPEFLPEPEARELLHNFLGSVSANGEISTYHDFVAITSRTQLALAIGSMVKHQGVPSPKVPGRVGIVGRVEGWHFLAQNDSPDGYRGTLVSQSRWGLVGGPKRRSVQFHHYNTRGAIAVDDTLGSRNKYYIDDANPQLKYSWRGTGEMSTYRHLEGGGNLPNIVILAKTRSTAPETIATRFLDISARLVSQLLKVTKDLS